MALSAGSLFYALFLQMKVAFAWLAQKGMFELQPVVSDTIREQLAISRGQIVFAVR